MQVSDRTFIGRQVAALFVETGGTSFHVLQEWEGYVTNIGDMTFTADLVDVTRQRTSAEEQGDFLLSDLDTHQQKKLRIGSVFSWAIGYERTRGGTKQRVSRLVFRELPKWTRADIDAAREYGKHFKDSIWWR